MSGKGAGNCEEQKPSLSAPLYWSHQGIKGWFEVMQQQAFVIDLQERVPKSLCRGAHSLFPQLGCFLTKQGTVQDKALNEFSEQLGAKGSKQSKEQHEELITRAGNIDKLMKSDIRQDGSPVCQNGRK
jgi:hypothetical protein